MFWRTFCSTIVTIFGAKTCEIFTNSSFYFREASLVLRLMLVQEVSWSKTTGCRLSSTWARIDLNCAILNVVILVELVEIATSSNGSRLRCLIGMNCVTPCVFGPKIWQAEELLLLRGICFLLSMLVRGLSSGSTILNISLEELFALVLHLNLAFRFTYSNLKHAWLIDILLIGTWLVSPVDVVQRWFIVIFLWMCTVYCWLVHISILVSSTVLFILSRKFLGDALSEVHI